MSLIESSAIYALFNGGFGIENIHVSQIDTLPRTDPVHAAGGCYCEECKHFIESAWPNGPWAGGHCKLSERRMAMRDFCSDGAPKQTT